MSTNAPLSAELSDAYPIMIFGPKEVEVESGTSGLERLHEGNSYRLSWQVLPFKWNALSKRCDL